MWQRISLWLLMGLFLFTGTYHFIDPEAYYPLIPPYFPFPAVINSLSGVLEIILGLCLFWERSRHFAGIGLVILMLLFIPAHIHFIQQDGCVGESLCIGVVAAWIRLLIIHPILIVWIWYGKNYQGRVI